jgi:LacI family gluconate utilization system Gnt-I transcriptional repressor
MKTRRARSSHPTHASSRLVDVARHANVSAMTVSRVLREPWKVSSDVRQRVERAIHEVGYVPNRLAQGLRSANSTKLVACIVPSLQNSLFSQTIQGMSDALRSGGLNLMVGDSSRSASEEEKLIEAFLAQRPSGFILHETVHTTRTRRLLAQSGLPVVEVGDLAARPLDMVVSYSNAAAARTMTTHLIKRGHRRIAFVTVPAAGNVRARKRREGYEAALRAAGIPSDHRLILETEGSYLHGGHAVVALRESVTDVEAVFFAGDVLAIGALLECARRHWRVPEDIAIASFDDFEVTATIEPRLTALDIPRYTIGRTAAELILQRLAGQDTASSTRIDVMFRLIDGSSV